jgi:exodeoxyribonuclease VII large subunit
VARAIAASTLPIISAVGHEVDFSIADLVADLRAPTPSAAAELVVQNRLELERHLDQLLLRLGTQMRSQLELLRSRLQGLEKRLKAPREQLRIQRLQWQQLVLRLEQAMGDLLGQHKRRFAVLAGQLDALSPLAVLGRGYAIIREVESGLVVKDRTQVVPGDHLRVQLAKGELSVVVEKDDK